MQEVVSIRLKHLRLIISRLKVLTHDHGHVAKGQRQVLFEQRPIVVLPVKFNTLSHAKIGVDHVADWARTHTIELFFNLPVVEVERRDHTLLFGKDKFLAVADVSVAIAVKVDEEMALQVEGADLSF